MIVNFCNQTIAGVFSTPWTIVDDRLLSTNNRSDFGLAKFLSASEISIESIFLYVVRQTDV